MILNISSNICDNKECIWCHYKIYRRSYYGEPVLPTFAMSYDVISINEACLVAWWTGWEMVSLYVYVLVRAHHSADACTVLAAECCQGGHYK